MERAGRRNAHFWRDATVALEELEMLDLRMTFEGDLAVDADGFMLRFDALWVPKTSSGNDFDFGW
jgi:hypothetical protein